MKFYKANWPAPKNIKAISTCRTIGFSQAPYDSNNLALHVGDNPQQVLENRRQLSRVLKLPAEPVWLNQTHSTHCIIAEEDTSRDADAAITRAHNHPLVIMTADCLPITLCNRQGTEIAAIHAGWKGLYHGIVENTLEKMHSPHSELLAWIGPAICGACYEVGAEVFESFTTKYPNSSIAFKKRGDKWLANLPIIAELVLKSQGVEGIYQSHLCTYELKNSLYSYRRAPQTGRIGTLIWFDDL